MNRETRELMRHLLEKCDVISLEIVSDNQLQGASARRFNIVSGVPENDRIIEAIRGALDED